MAEQTKKPRQTKAVVTADFMKEARDRHERGITAERNNRDQAVDDQKFLAARTSGNSKASDQWSDEAKTSRSGRPMLTINRLPGFVDQIIGDARQNRVAIKINPVDDNSDPITARVFEGIIRNIESVSKAASTYINAFEQAVGSAWGYFRVITEYADEESFDKEIRIKRIANKFSVVLDPDAKEIDKSDAKYGFVSERISRTEFKKQYPKAKPLSFDEGKDNSVGWFENDYLRIADYYKMVPDPEKQYELIELAQEEPITLQDDLGEDLEAYKAYYGVEPIVLLDELGNKHKIINYDGVALPADQLPPAGKEFIDQGFVKIVRSRKVNGQKVVHHKITGNEILEKSDWPGKFIPIIPMYGKEINVEGETVLRGAIRHAKDPQRGYNYTRSTIVEVIGLQPKVPFLIEEGQIGDHAKAWNTAHSTPYPYLPYKKVDGVMPPSRPDVTQPSIALFQESTASIDDLKATTGMYDPSIGAQGKEISGKAIIATQRKGDTGNFAYFDNMAIAISHCGRILLDLIPKIYDTKRAVRILGEDETPQIVKLGEMGLLKGLGENGVDVEQTIDLQAGKYDVAVSVGPAYTTRRIEAVESMTRLAETIPMLAPAIVPIVVDLLDVPGADKLKEKIKLMTEQPPDGGVIPGQDPGEDPNMSTGGLPPGEPITGIEPGV